MKPIFIVAILVMATLPLYAQAQQPDKAKLKADSQKVVSIIKGDKVKTQGYCQIADLGEQMDQAVKERDKKKFEELAQRIKEGEKQLGPEYLALIDAVRDMDQNSKEVEEIASMFDKLDESCPH
jgi:preprotein translocase subunit YajC